MREIDSQSVQDLFDLSDSVAWVTGATGQVGQAVCNVLVELGCQVAITARTEEDCQKLAQSLSDKKNNVIPVPADVTSERDIERGVDKVKKEFGKINILVNGAYSGDNPEFEEMEKRDFLNGLEIGVTSAFLCTREAMPSLLETRGSIINIGSIYGVVAPDHSIYGDTGLNNPVHYGVAKAGLAQLSRWVASRYGEKGVTANTIILGGIYNEELEEIDGYTEIFVPNYEKRTPLQRMGLPKDIKGPVALLASDAGSWITGQNIVVDGGWTTW